MMKNELIEVPMSKGCVAIFTTRELLDELPPSLLMRGLKRGKSVRRRRQMVEREATRQ